SKLMLTSRGRPPLGPPALDKREIAAGAAREAWRTFLAERGGTLGGVGQAAQASETTRFQPLRLGGMIRAERAPQRAPAHRRSDGRDVVGDFARQPTHGCHQLLGWYDLPH